MLLPYNYRKDDDTYKFSTIEGVEYYAVFTDGQHNFPQNPSRIFEFSFYYTSSQKGKGDQRVYCTIVSLIKDFLLSNNIYGLTFVCDSTDDKHFIRSRLFDFWFNRDNTNQFYKINGRVDSDNEVYLNSLITSLENPHLDELVADYSVALMSYNDPNKTRIDNPSL